MMKLFRLFNKIVSSNLICILSVLHISKSHGEKIATLQYNIQIIMECLRKQFKTICTKRANFEYNFMA